MLSAIQNRQAVRKFTNAPVNSNDIDELINAFQASPCGMHQTDVMKGIVIESPDLCAEIEKATNNACYGAPLLFAIATKKDSNFGERDASSAAENIMLQATELGYGSVYIMSGDIELNNHPSLLKKLGISNDFQISVIVPVGKAAEQPAHEDRTNRYQIIRK